jgi:hypothetical protein
MSTCGPFDCGFEISDFGLLRSGILDFGLKEDVKDIILGYGVHGKRQKNQNKNRPHSSYLKPFTLYHFA